MTHLSRAVVKAEANRPATMPFARLQETVQILSEHKRKRQGDTPDKKQVIGRNALGTSS